MTAGSFVRILAKRGTNFCVRLDYIHGVSTVVVDRAFACTYSVKGFYHCQESDKCGHLHCQYLRF